MRKTILLMMLASLNAFAEGKQEKSRFQSVENKLFKCLVEIKQFGSSEEEAIHFIDDSFSQMKQIYPLVLAQPDEAVTRIQAVLSSCKKRREEAEAAKLNSYSLKDLKQAPSFEERSAAVRSFYEVAYQCFGGTLRFRAGFVFAFSAGVDGLKCTGTDGRTRFYIGASLGKPVYPSFGAMVSVDPVDSTLVQSFDFNADDKVIKTYKVNNGNDSYDFSAWAFVYGETYFEKDEGNGKGRGVGGYVSTGKEVTRSLDFRIPKLSIGPRNWNVIRYAIIHDELPEDRKDINHPSL